MYEGEWALARQWREVDELERAKGKASLGLGAGRCRFLARSLILLLHQSKSKKQKPLPDVSMSMFESLRLESSAEYDLQSRVLRPRVLLEVE